jgi:hypothetical protein
MTRGQALDLLDKAHGADGQVVEVKVQRDGNHENSATLSPISYEQASGRMDRPKGPPDHTPSIRLPATPEEALEWVNLRAKQQVIREQLEEEQKRDAARKAEETRDRVRRAEVEGHLSRHGLQTMMAFYTPAEIKLPGTSNRRGMTTPEPLSVQFNIPGYWEISLRIIPNAAFTEQLQWYYYEDESWTPTVSLDVALARSKKDDSLGVHVRPSKD